jgi:predicted SprT family Zn-dependent metalloprotease
MPSRLSDIRTLLLERTLYGGTDARVVKHAARYIDILDLPTEHLRITSDRAEYGSWLGRRISSAYGGAYCFMRREGIHAVLINLERIDISAERAIEIVVAEELIHMRDHLDGDLRRHAKHGYDRIAHRVADLTGATLDEIRSVLLPVRRHPFRYIYACPNCSARVPRKRKGTWSCGRCSPTFNRRYVLRIVEELPVGGQVRDVQ